MDIADIVPELHLPGEAESGIIRYEDASLFNCLVSYIACFLLSSLFVASLYIWKPVKDQPSSHPETMKKRFISIFMVVLICPKFVGYFINQDLLKDCSLWKLMGLRLEGIIPAMILPVLLTVILFLGPLSMEAFVGLWRIYTEPWFWLTYMKEMIWIRNYIVAPIAEEFTFRACMLVLIIHCTRPMTAVFICPIFFGAAHLHHMVEQIRLGVKWKVAFLTSSFQFCYTSIFGAYSAYLFLRTGHLIAPVLVHSFCNHMGFPDIWSLKEMPASQRRISIACFVSGVILWALLLNAVTDPQIYSNDLPWSKMI